MNETEKKLLQGARECLIKEGHRRTTIKRIAEYAGVNHGLVHHYFGSKEGLLLALLEQTQQGAITGFFDENQLPQTSSASQENALKQFLEFTRSHAAGESLMLEFLAMSAESSVIAEKLRKVIHSRRQLFQKMFGVSEGEATLLISLVLGTFIQSQIDPEIPVDALLERFASLFTVIQHPK